MNTESVIVTDEVPARAQRHPPHELGGAVREFPLLMKLAPVTVKEVAPLTMKHASLLPLQIELPMATVWKPMAVIVPALDYPSCW